MSLRGDQDQGMRRLAILVCALVVGLGATTATASSHSSAAAPVCKQGYYKNVDGKCVHSPSKSPAGATAKCRDSTYSYSLHARGTCSHHGGVARWIHHP